MVCLNCVSWCEVDLLRFSRFARRRFFGELSSKSCALRCLRGCCIEICGVWMMVWCWIL